MSLLTTRNSKIEQQAIEGVNYIKNKPIKKKERTKTNIKSLFAVVAR